MEKININDSTDFYDNARSSRNEKAQRRVNGQKGDIDASGWKEPTMETERKTGGRPVPRAFKRGGKVEGEESKQHAGRKPRASGGKLASYARKAIEDVMDASERYSRSYDKEGNSEKTQSLADRGEKRGRGIDLALKKFEGKAKVPATRASGGKVHAKGCTCKMCNGGEAKVSRETRATGGSANYEGGTRPTGGRLAHAKGGKAVPAKGESAKGATRTSSDVRSPTRTSTSTKADTKGNVTVTGGAGDGDTTVNVSGKRAKKAFGGTLIAGERMPRKDGGRTKGKTDIHININSAPKPPMPMPLPMPPAGAMPPPMPAGGPPMGAGPLPPGLGVPPPAMGAGPMPRKSGGRANLDAGAGGGLGRLEKIEIQKRH